MMSPSMERRLLQAAVAVLALVPLSAGLAGAVSGLGLVDAQGDVSADSHVRYLSGLLLGIGLGFWSCLARIEARTARFRVLTAIVLVGGLARLSGALAFGAPEAVIGFALVMELVVTPALCLWQGRIARVAAPRGKLHG